jgi:hypothetical protein
VSNPISKKTNKTPIKYGDCCYYYEYGYGFGYGYGYCGNDKSPLIKSAGKVYQASPQDKSDQNKTEKSSKSTKQACRENPPDKSVMKIDQNKTEVFQSAVKVRQASLPEESAWQVRCSGQV